MKKKVLLISESVAGGLRKHIIQLIDNLDRKKFEVYFIHGESLLDVEFKRRYENLKSECHVIVCKKFVREIDINKDLATLLFLIKEIREIKPDIVHCHSSKAGVLGRLAARICGVKKIFYTPHAYSFLANEFSNNKKIFFKKVEKSINIFSKSITFNVSEGEREQAIKNNLGVSSRFKVIYNGLPVVTEPDRLELRNRFNLPEDAIVIGNNARMSAQKDPTTFMNIAKNVVVKDKKFHFVWAGDGPLLKEMRAFLKRNKLENNVHLLGDQFDSEYIVKMYDLFFISSLYEGLPYGPIEALRMKVPVMGFNTVGIREIIPDSLKKSFLINLRDINEVENLIFSKKYLERFCIDQSFEYYQKNFLESTMIKNIELEYCKL